MSETKHYTGKLKPTSKTPNQYDSEVTDMEVFNDLYYEKAVVINGLVYEVEMTSTDPYQDIFISRQNDDESIDFEIKYYNGGCGFDEAIDYALGNINSPN